MFCILALQSSPTPAMHRNNESISTTPAIESIAEFLDRKQDTKLGREVALQVDQISSTGNKDI